MVEPGKDYIGVATPFYCLDGEGRMLFQKRGNGTRDERGTWDPGGGKLKKGLELEQNVKREVREELNTDCEVLDSLPPHSSFPEDREKEEQSHWVVVPFFIRVDPEKVEINEPEKIEKLEWRKLNNFPEPLHSGFKETFRRYRKQFEARLND